LFSPRLCCTARQARLECKNMSGPSTKYCKCCTPAQVRKTKREPGSTRASCGQRRKLASARAQGQATVRAAIWYQSPTLCKEHELIDVHRLHDHGYTLAQKCACNSIMALLSVQRRACSQVSGCTACAPMHPSRQNSSSRNLTDKPDADPLLLSAHSLWISMGAACKA